MSERMVIVHGTDLLRRGFLTAAPDATTSVDGRPTHALYGLIRALRTALGFKTPRVGVAIVDSTVALAEPALREQATVLPDLLRAHGFVVLDLEDAVHLVASYTEAALGHDYDVVIVGSDKRLAQLVQRDRVWWYDAYKDVRYTPDSVRKRFEVEPPYVAGWLGLVGDDDHLPGVKGIGKKGAKDLVAQFGSVEKALDEHAAIGGRTGKALTGAGIEAARAEVRRATLHRDRPLPEPLDALPFSPPDEASLQTRYRELGFIGLLSASAPAAADLEVTMANTEAQWEAAREALGTGPVALEVVSDGPSPVRGTAVGLALVTEAAAVYVPLPAAFEGLAGYLADANAAKLAHDSKAVAVALARHADLVVRGWGGDVMAASHLHQPSGHAPHDLEDVARAVLHRPLPSEDELRGTGKRRKRWSAVDRQRTARWAAERAKVALQLWEELEPTTPPALFAEYMELNDLLRRIELRGIGVDADDLRGAGADFDRIGRDLETEIFELAGKRFNIGSTKQLGTVLFDELGLPVIKRTKTGYSVANAALERIEHAHPIVSLVMRWRLLRRLTDNWVHALIEAIEPDGRVRSTFYAARSFTSRLVNAQPDLGRVPAKTEEMTRIRHAFRPAPGYVLLSVDYRQLGLYVLAHLTGDPHLVEPLRREADMHTLTAAAVLDRAEADIDQAARQIGKVVNFATFAGQGASALALQLGVSAAEAKTVIARFDQRYAVTRQFQEAQLELVRTRGYVETLAGRRWPIGGLDSPDLVMRSYAERLARRATHEASVADVCRRGMLAADRVWREEGVDGFPLLQVLDEVLFEVREDQLERGAELAAEAMVHAVDTRVPLRVGCKAGPNWASLAPLRQD
ncbi:MAG: DNA polymerase [Myxococcota bacterium]